MAGRFTPDEESQRVMGLRLASKTTRQRRGSRYGECPRFDDGAVQGGKQETGYRAKRKDDGRKLASAFRDVPVPRPTSARLRRSLLSDFRPRLDIIQLLIYMASMESLPALRRCALAQCRRPSRASPVFLDFLAPSTLRHHQTRQASASGSCAPSKPRYFLSKQQREYLDGALRVNQAGELAATLIYTAQTPQVVRSHPHLRPLMRHMYDQEAGHLKTFNGLVAKHQIRPTAMYPIWEAAATFLGWSTAALGREAAMACTEAVETEIGTHYNDQVREILSWEADADRRGEELDDELKDMLSTFRRIRDEELEHLDHAVANDAKEAKPYDPLVDVIRIGCRTAIKISERV